MKRTLLPVVLFGFALLVSPSCKSSSAGASSGAANGSAPGSFTTSDLAGDWTGLLDPTGDGRESYPFYLRCDGIGFPIAGADSRSRDWAVPQVLSYAWVRSSGAVSISIIQDTELLFLNGDLLGGGLFFSGSYLMLEDGVEISTGNFDSFLSSGMGSFSLGDQLQGKWSGTMEKKAASAQIVRMVVDSMGMILSGDLDGDSFLAINGSLPSLDLDLDSVGRLGALHLETGQGQVFDFPFLLVDERGDLFGGAGVEIGSGEVFLHLARSRG